MDKAPPLTVQALSHGGRDRASLWAGQHVPDTPADRQQRTRLLLPEAPLTATAAALSFEPPVG